MSKEKEEANINFFEELFSNFINNRCEVLGGLLGTFIGLGLSWISQQYVYSRLRDLKECAETYRFCADDWLPFWVQVHEIISDSRVATIMNTIGLVVGGTVGIFIFKYLKKSIHSINRREKRK
ncbi:MULTISPECIES: hypothetical protein [Nostoc]|uniref:Uncharacterized protein n=1 Tax=Nostoc paludosum FACHB-159 TaxID=2692908 RepID=A0ABR8KKI8_9NOSO|nr:MULTISPECIES: hypothetical protein [Nostoc]MBD2682909.1 hypothetical protein [Nostoc sp. FACHB-857]MBD2739246.1 hypothetical protein [Nostoc paludosum FACHB-159]